MVSRDDDFLTPSVAAKSTFIRGGDFHVSLNDDDKRHIQCVGAMNPSFIAWSWSVHAHRVAAKSTFIRGGDFAFH